MKFVMLGLGIVCLLAIAGFGLLRWVMKQPLYKPGSVSKLDLAPVGNQTESRWKVSSGITLNHFSTGAGQNILYVHGGPGIPLEASAPAFDMLGDRNRVHYYDQRGTGKSTRPFDQHIWESNTWSNIQLLEGELGIAQQIADIERIRRILGDGQIIIAGHSYGGLLASLYAAEFPENVGSLVLIAPADLLVLPSPNEDFFDVIKGGLPHSEHAEFDKWKKEYFDLGKIFGKTTPELEALDERFAGFFEQATKTDLPEHLQGEIGVWHVRAQYFSLGKSHDWRKLISAYEGSALIIHGERDLQSPDVSEMYARALPGAQTKVIPGAGHFPHFTHPDEVNELMRNFLHP